MTAPTPEERIAKLEAQVDALRRALALLTVAGQPTANWLDATFARIEEES